jgi:hypothetical protein
MGFGSLRTTQFFFWIFLAPSPLYALAHAHAQQNSSETHASLNHLATWRAAAGQASYF